MKRTLPVIVLVVALAALCSAQKIAFDTPYDASAFSAKFTSEGPVQHASKTLDSPVGKVLQYSYTHEFHNGDAAVVLGYIDAPPGTNINLEKAMDGMFEALSGAKETRPRVNASLGRLSARSGAATGFTGEGEKRKPVTTFVRVAADGNHLWSVVFLCTNNVSCTEADAAAFCDTVNIK